MAPTRTGSLKSAHAAADGVARQSSAAAPATAVHRSTVARGSAPLRQADIINQCLYTVPVVTENLTPEGLRVWCRWNGLSHGHLLVFSTGAMCVPHRLLKGFSGGAGAGL